MAPKKKPFLNFLNLFAKAAEHLDKSLVANVKVVDNVNEVSS